MAREENIDLRNSCSIDYGSGQIYFQTVWNYNFPAKDPGWLWLFKYDNENAGDLYAFVLETGAAPANRNAPHICQL